LTFGFGIGKKKIKIRILDEHPGSYFRELRNNFFWLKIIKFFDADPDLGWKKFGSGIRDKHPGSNTEEI
jgi:hypothetical protein